MGGERYSGRVDRSPIDFSALSEVTRYIAHSGRPLAELRADPSVLKVQRRTGVVFRHKKCPFDDSRSNYHDALMNQPAFEEIDRNRQTFFDGLAWINNFYFGGSMPQNITADQVRDMALIGMRLPDYLVLRAENPIAKDRIPDVVGNIYKAAQGIEVSASLIIDDFEPSVIVSPELLYHAANAEREETFPLLVSANGKRMCSASQEDIIESSQALLYKEGGDPDRSELGHYIDSEELLKVVAFAHVVTDYVSLKESFRRQKEILKKRKEMFSQMSDSDIMIAALDFEQQRITNIVLSLQDQHRQALNRSLGRELLSE